LASAFLRTHLLPRANKDGADPDLALAKFSVAIDQLGLSNGQINYRDERTKPTLKLSLNGISGDIMNLLYPVARDKGTMSLTGSIEGYPFKIEGETKLMQSPPSAEIDFAATSLPLKLFGPLVKGRVKNIDTNKAMVDVTHRVVFDEQSPSRETQLKIRNIVPEKPGTTMATAFALMSGSGGVTIELKEERLPSRAIIDEALNKFSRTMIKASINPLLLADSKFVDLVEKDFVSFQPGTDQFTGDGLEYLNRYGELLSTYPLVNLKITGVADPEGDVAILREQLEKAEQIRVDVENQKRALEWQKKQELERMRLEIWAEEEDSIDEVDIPVANDSFVPVSPQPVKVTNEVLNELARQRQQAVADYLIETLSIAPERLIQAETEGGGIVSGGDSPKAVISLTDGYSKTEESEDQDEEEPST
ncbi:MAG: DUF748 domain-containing protein, partial [Desulfobulbaceae bacterium]